MTHKGLNIKTLTRAVGGLINLADGSAEVIPRFEQSFETNDQTSNAGRDEKTDYINVWYVMPFLRRTKETRSECEQVSSHRNHEAKFYLRFIFKFPPDKDETTEEDKQEANDAFFEKLETVCDKFSLSDILSGNLRARHTGIQFDGIAKFIKFRRQDCLEATCSLQVFYDDTVIEE